MDQLNKKATREITQYVPTHCRSCVFHVSIIFIKYIQIINILNDI